jgi:hypothetical protein
VRTDKHRNPTAFTTDVAKLAGLVQGVDFEQGDPFTVPGPHGPITYYTARLLLDPIKTTIRVIDKCGFYTHYGSNRWVYMAMPTWLWLQQTAAIKLRIIGEMYLHEGGTDLRYLFPSLQAALPPKP